MPIALAILLTFVLSPPVTWLQRWIGRIPAVLAMVTLVFSVLGLAGWGLAWQVDHLAEDLPRYRVNILSKIADVRGAGKGGVGREAGTAGLVLAMVIFMLFERRDLPDREAAVRGFVGR